MQKKKSASVGGTKKTKRGLDNFWYTMTSYNWQFWKEVWLAEIVREEKEFRC